MIPGIHWISRVIYIYWKDRDDLLLSLYAEAFHRMSEDSLQDFHLDLLFREGL